MSYNWQSAATPQGRERLKELMDKGERIPIREDDAFGKKRIVEGAKIGNTYFIGQHGFPLSMWTKWDMSDVEFLDPEPQPQQPDDAPEGYHVVTFAKDQQPGENGLLPCPFCGGSAEVDLVVDICYSWYKVGCKHDLCIGFTANHFMFREMDDAKHDWNQRHQ